MKIPYLKIDFALYHKGHNIFISIRPKPVCVCMTLVDSTPANAASDERIKEVEESPLAVNLSLILLKEVS